MRQIRLFTHQVLKQGILVELEDGVKHHIDKVLRLKKGADITLFNGDGYDYHGALTYLDRHQALVQLHSHEAVNNECDIDITLYCALLKGDTMDRVVQKSVELGVKKLVLLQTKHTDVTFKPERLKSKMVHWQGVIYASSQQCGRARIMEIEQPIAFNEAIYNTHQLCWIFSPHHDVGLIINNDADITDIGLMVGPEGGFHADEVNEALIAGWRAKSLGARVLRADTAAMSAIIMAQYAYSQEFKHD